MGLFGGDDDDTTYANNNQNAANDLANQQLLQNQADLEAKRQSLTNTRLSIIKSQAGQSWVPNVTAQRTAPITPSNPIDDLISNVGGGGSFFDELLRKSVHG